MDNPPLILGDIIQWVKNDFIKIIKYLLLESVDFTDLSSSTRLLRESKYGIKALFVFFFQSSQACNSRSIRDMLTSF